jgi:DNA invertase Pin-like site-specific DNA recombinase
MATVFSYVRMSTRKQLDGDSLRRQLAMSDEWIRANGHTLSPIKLHDLGRSGYHGANLGPSGKLALFLSLIEAGRVKPGDILLVEALDRLSRQQYSEAEKVFRSILDAGVTIVTLKPYEAQYTKETVARDPMALTIPLMAFHLAHLESLNKGNRHRSRWDNMRAISQTTPGFKFNKRRPSWLSWDERRNTFIENENAAAVRFIFEATAEGMGQRKLLGELQKKFKPYGKIQRWDEALEKRVAVSRSWNTSYINKVLNDRAVLGERQSKTEVDGNRVAVGNAIKDYYPAVIDEDLWYRAQAAKAANLKKKGPNGKFVNLFTGIVFNAHDGHSMVLQTTRASHGRQRRLVSSGHWQKIEGSDPLSVDLPTFESIVLRYLSELRPQLLGTKTGKSEIRAKEQELKGVEVRLARIEADLPEAEADEYTMLRAAARTARIKRDEIRSVLDSLKAKSSGDKPLIDAQDVITLLASATDADRNTLRFRLRSLIAEFVETIFVKPEKHFGRVYCLAQINFNGGLVKTVQFGPGFQSGSSVQHEVNSFGAIRFDLRDRKAASKSIFRKLATELAKPALAPVFNTVPKAIGEAAGLWLRVRKAQMSKASFRVIPAKIRRFVDFVGDDTPTSQVGVQHWKLFTRWLKAEVSDGKLSKATARVAYSRVREFVRWLVDNQATPAFKGTEQSAAKALT